MLDQVTYYDRQIEFAQALEEGGTLGYRLSACMTYLIIHHLMPSRIEAQRGIARTFPGFTYLREATYTCGGITNTVQECRHDLTGIEMTLIPAGIFLMGFREEEVTDWVKEEEIGRELTSDAIPAHTVQLSAFFIGKYPVKQSQWEQVMGNNPSKYKGPDHPVERVNWKDTMKFCKKSGLNLPTEAQWEYACRAGTSTRFYWGKDPEEKDVEKYCWCFSNSDFKTHPVGQKEPNAFGLYDMSGNVWEWCYDCGAYPDTDLLNPILRKRRKWEFLRGGSFNDESWLLTSAFRGFYKPSYRDRTLGLRVAFHLFWEFVQHGYEE
ncbi:MAG: formylglycine-generating enzyme family protein [Spirochaetota bacterium]